MTKPRPTILVAEPESIHSLSIRKLVLETAKFNVLTAHSTAEALALFELFPRISAAVLVNDGAIDCDRVAGAVKRANAGIPIVGAAPGIGQKCDSADHNVSSHEPDQLVKLMRSLLGDPRSIDEKQQKNPPEH